MSPATSLRQQRFMAMILDAKRKGRQLAGKAGDTENAMGLSDLEDFASTPTDNLPLKSIKKKKAGGKNG